MSAPELLRIEALSKSFGEVIALRSVSMALQQGSIYGLAGENGAGKSTLIKIFSGVHSAGGGRMLLDGNPYAPRHPADAAVAGISVFHQEIPVCPNLSVAANIFLGPRFPGRGFFPDWAEMEQRSRQLFRQLLGTELDPRRLMRDCTIAERQLALLARVLSHNARLIILDEPTTALTPNEVSSLFAVLRRLKGQGVTFLFVSHLLDELIAICDEIYVLRDGQHAGHLKRDQFDPGVLATLIAGRQLAEAAARPGRRAGTGPKLEARGLSLAGAFENISFQIMPGEILGLAGLQGSGRSALARALFAAPPADRGQLLFKQAPVVLRTIGDAIRLGIGYVPEDRKTLGLFDDLDIQSNLGLLRLKSVSACGLVSRGRLRALALEMAKQLQIRFSSSAAPVTSLSGGNQQKVLIARWLSIKPEVLVMNEPTRGVDVGAKAEIVRLIQNLAEDGCSIIVASSDFDELLRLSDRILVMHRGRVTAEFPRSIASKERLIQAAASSGPAHFLNP